MLKIFSLMFGILFMPILVFAGSSEVEDYGRTGQRIERLSKELSLSADQEAKLQAIMREQHEKIRAILEKSHRRIREVLTAEQITKWEALKNQHHENRYEMNPDNSTVNQ